MLPFVQINGFWYVITDWSPGIKKKPELQLRLLNKREVSQLNPDMEDAIMEVWAKLFPDDEAIKSGVRSNQKR